jgi:hypothetical protein
MLKFTLCIVAVICLASSTLADDIHAPGDAVPGMRGVTYAALLKQVVPDLKKSGDSWSGKKLPPLRHLLGKDYDNGAPDTLSVSQLASLTVREHGRDRLLVLTLDSNSDSWFALLAAFDDSRKPKLLDKANVATDQMTGFYDTPVLHLANGSDAVFVSSAHFNSNQGYRIVTALTLQNGSLQPAFDIFTLSDHACTYDRRQDLSFAAKGSDIVAKVVETTTLSGDDCGEKPPVEKGVRTITDTYRWDAKKERYFPTSKALEKLAKQNVDGL